MKIKSDNFVLEVIDKKVIYNLRNIEYSNYNDLYEILKKYIARKDITRLVLYDDKDKLNDIEQLVLLVLSNFYKSLYIDRLGIDQDITFSYNFPIYEEKWIIPRILEIADISFKSNMVALGDSKDFIVVDVSDNDSYKEFYRKNGRTIRFGDKNIRVRNSDLSFTLNYWNDYCFKKHNVRFSQDAINVYLDIYSTLGFNSINLYYGKEIIATTLYFKNEDNKRLYFCITGWDDKYKFLSPGIYLYSKGIEYCHNNGYNFSFCYGLQSYKSKLLEPFIGDSYVS